jgi:hypothetical protein
MLRMAQLCALAGLAGAVAPAVADWDPGDPYKMHWPQLPDLAETGLDVYDTTYWEADGTVSQKWLADDWRCTETGPVTDIHIWGSWLNDQVPQHSDTGTHGTFAVEIYSDIPADQSPTGYSMPGEPLWGATFGPAAYRTRFYADAPEQFYNPNLDEIMGTDTQVWQYNFLVPAADAFFQEEGIIYWLSITHFDPTEDGIIDTLDAQYLFGWKTTPLEYNFNDDAVYSDAPPGTLPPLYSWGEMHYPSGHPWSPESINLSFVITPEPASLVLLALGGLLMARRG